MTWQDMCAVGLGGALGSVVRYALTIALCGTGNPTFPWATFLINISGSLLIGLVIGLPAGSLPPTLRIFLGVGVLGGYTTFSTFSFDALALAGEGAPVMLALYTLGSVALGIGAALAGVTLSRAIFQSA